jgi:glycosyltransferase involved in cell wall biosynthesis
LRKTDPDPELRRKASTIIAFAGVMGYQDGVDYLMRALGHLVFDLGRTDVFCAFIGGKGDARADLKALATRLGLDPYVWFTGWVSDEDYVRYLNTADICVAPDPANPFTDRSTMIKVMEYMALEKPIVAFDLTEHRYSARDAAVYVQPNDEREMARTLAELIDDPERRRAMGAYGRQRVEQELAWPNSVPNLLAAYQAALNG